VGGPLFAQFGGRTGSGALIFAKVSGLFAVRFFCRPVRTLDCRSFICERGVPWPCGICSSGSGQVCQPIGFVE